ncbi:uncharacterized protein LOC132257222 [Phlebotomus argentipes]|uniref:uncharacterized protein LOC132257222 n=1 Tax=Phlebotomus argentipes TaxID=94469 RepID=UPI002892F7C2|nr:uncharacterized protein LOC132257222 [Phlebotomus argentipes]
MFRFLLVVISSISLSGAIQSPENISSRRSQNTVNFFPDDTRENYNTAHGVNANDVSPFRFQDDQGDLNQNEILVSPAQKFQQSPYQRPQSPYYSSQYANPAVTHNLRPNPYAGSYGYYNPDQEDREEGRPQTHYPYQQRPQLGPNYAAQFASYYRPGGVRANFPGNFQQVGGSPPYDNRRPLADVGVQFGQAIENIARYDDLQCVPKILCQMVGNPNRQSSLPSFLSAPSLTALISALPSTSPALIFGRAALLGFSGGESRCDSAYPRCPRNEDEVLNYLNNHRGGFFRFFNGGASFGEDLPNYQQNYRPTYQQQGNYQTPSYQQTQQPSFDLNSLQTLLQGGSQSQGINLSNLGLNQGSNTINLGSLASLIGAGGGGQSSGASTLSSLSSLASLIGGSDSQSQSSGLSQLAGNLLTGLVGARFAGRSNTRRRISKRHIDDKLGEGFNNSGELNNLLKSFSEQSKPDARITSKKRNLNDELGDLSNVKVDQKKKKYHGEDVKKDYVKTLQKLLNTESRIVKLDTSKEIKAQDRIFTSGESLEAEDRIMNIAQMPSIHQLTTFNPIAFPQEYLYVSSDESNRVPKLVSFGPPSSLEFPNQFQFETSELNLPQKFFPEPFQNSDGIILDIPKPLPLEYYDRTKMIFPDRTGTGNLRFDNEFFGSENIHGNRFGRILTGLKRPQIGTHTGFAGNGASTITYSNGDILVFHQNRLQGLQQQYPINFHGQNLASTSQSYQYPQVSSTYPTRSDSGNIYVTNSLGVNEYYINAQGQKIRL